MHRDAQRRRFHFSSVIMNTCNRYEDPVDFSVFQN